MVKSPSKNSSFPSVSPMPTKILLSAKKSSVLHSKKARDASAGSTKSSNLLKMPKLGSKKESPPLSKEDKID